MKVSNIEGHFQGETAKLSLRFHLETSAVSVGLGGLLRAKLSTNGI
jgi:hypothetical protein